MKDVAIYNNDVLAKNCEVTKTQLTINEGTSIEDWLSIGELLKSIKGSVQFWLGDWLRYGERHYGEMYSQALDTTAYEYGTLKDAKWVAEKVEKSLRKDNLSFNHHKEVAKLQPQEQEHWLEKAESEGLSVRSLRQGIADSRRKLSPLPDDKYDVIYATPFAKVLNSQSLTLDEICDLGLSTADDSALFLWTTPPKLKDALTVIDAWGFDYKTHAIWDKGVSETGLWFRERHELLMIATKGSFPAPAKEDIVESILNNQPNLHGRGLIYDLIESICPSHRYLELFKQNNRDNWDSWRLEE